ncbi:TetR/AcrR family transcriptional regulator [Pedobacter polaris]|uniref:TetR/AcrR family transcriptional regulator n=1 Tax=Pedobacter polaris TaxID=2571273 RepID=A0A4U1CFX9_9SPHI|nr:TetR/AcrR family transcriptional regulator [Pedobacter polaris]TKC05381.1 TetR/AcrR family transcriptional regulator [Pedobacter polaris]
MTKAERTRAFIIEKTAPIFNKKGFAGTSLNDITAATGLTKGSIYGNFANKDEVALAVFDYNFERANAGISQQIAGQKDAESKLLVYVSAYTDFFNTQCEQGGCPVLNTAVEADDTHPKLRKKAAAAVLAWKNKIVAIINDGIANKEFRSEVNASQMALTMIAMIEGAIMISKLLNDKNHIADVMQSMKKMIIELS